MSKETNNILNELAKDCFSVGLPICTFNGSLRFNYSGRTTQPHFPVGNLKERITTHVTTMKNPASGHKKSRDKELVKKNRACSLERQKHCTSIQKMKIKFLMPFADIPINLSYNPLLIK